MKPYVYSPESGKVTRAYGAHSRYGFMGDVGRIYQYLDIIAHAWDWHGADPQASVGKEAKRHSEATVDAVAKALSQFEADTSKAIRLIYVRGVVG